MKEALRGTLLSVLFFALILGGSGLAYANDKPPACDGPGSGWCTNSGGDVVYLAPDYCGRWGRISRWSGRIAMAAGIASAAGMGPAVGVFVVAGAISIWAGAASEGCG